ncbi:MAG: hypothetical protein QXR87_04665 [Candidatus Hadarchaeales archaeon]
MGRDSFDEWVESTANWITSEVRKSIEEQLRTIPPEKVKEVEVEFSGEVPPEQLKRVLDVQEPAELARLGSGAYFRLPDLREPTPGIDLWHWMVHLRHRSVEELFKRFVYGPPRTKVALKIIAALGGKLVGMERSATTRENGTYRVTITARYQMPTLEDTSHLLELMQTLHELPAEEVEGLEALTCTELPKELVRRGVLSRVMKEG